MRNLGIWSLLFMVALIGQAQVVRNWSAESNGSGDFTDVFTCATIDQTGNVYLGGYTIQPGNNQDYLVVKINALGDTVWTSHLDWLDHGQDQVLAIAVNDNGQVAVTGFAKSILTSSDMLTVLFDANGDTTWARTYNHPLGNEYDQGNTVAIDASGNVVVAGYGDRDPLATSNNDLLTLSYTSAGVEKWAQIYNGTGNARDQAAQVVLDAQGNAYVTGRSNNLAGDDDFLTVKYNTTGVQQWLRRDDQGQGGTDRATCITLDVTGNVLVSGRSDNGNDDDYWTIKINSAGALVWSRLYNFVDDDRAIALVTDAAGAVYVTGQSDGDATAVRNWDYLTLKFDAAGTLVWTRRYASASAQNDIPTGIAVGGANVFVTGNTVISTNANGTTINDIHTASYDAIAGTIHWEANYVGAGGQDDGAAAVVATADGCTVAGYTQDAGQQADAIALHYAATNALAWERRYSGVGDNGDNVNAIAVDAGGNVFVAGYHVQKNQDRNIALWKLDQAGVNTCNFSLSGSSTPSPDAAQGIGLDANGNAVIAGYVKNSGDSYAMWWAKYIAPCDTQYTRVYNATPSGSDKVYDMVTDASGNLFVTGKVDADATYLGVNDDCFLAKVNSLGAILWSRTYSSGGNNEDRGIKIALSPAGNIYLTGKALVAGNYDIFTLQYDAAGTQGWVQTYAGAFGNDEPYDLAVDANENVYVTGRTEETTAGQYDYITLKYSGGTQAWAMTYGGSGAGDDQAQSLGVDATGNVYVTGRADVDGSANENLDLVTLKYDAAGTLAWTHVLGDAAGADDHADDLAVHSSGNVYVTAHVNKGTLAVSDFDVMTYILDPAGSIMWQDSFDGGRHQDDVPSVLLLKGNEFYVGGSTYHDAEQKNMLLISYGGTVAAPEAHQNMAEVSLFPNPANEVLHVRVDALHRLQNTWILRDVTGRKVQEMRLDPSGESAISLQGLVPGIYLYTIQQGGHSIAKGKVVRQ